MSSITNAQKKEAHKYFSSKCFNQVWDYLEMDNRSEADDMQMLLLAFASLWHWTQRDDCTNQQESVGLWMISRVHAELEDGEGALRYGQKCLAISKKPGVSSFYLGYAYEALARANALLGNIDELQESLEQAQSILETLTDDDEKKYLKDDLRTIL